MMSGPGSIGMLGALRHAPAMMPESNTFRAGGLIRTLGVGLIAVAVVAAGLLLTRQRQVRLATDGGGAEPAGVTEPADRVLESIRTAGL
jgi:hypothetical protein